MAPPATPSDLSRVLAAFRGAVTVFLPQDVNLTAWARSLGRAGNYFSRFLSGERAIGLVELIRFLERSEVRPRLFFEEVVERLPEESLPQLLQQFTRALPAAEAAQLPPAGLVDLAEQLLLRPVFSSTGRRVLQAELDEIDDTRFANADIARIRLEQILESRMKTLILGSSLDKIELAEIVDGLGLWAVIARMRDRLTPALTGYELAARLAENCCEPGSTALLLHRISVLFCSMRQPGLALRLLDRAVRCYAEAQDVAGISKTFIDRGVALSLFERFDDATLAYEAGLNLVAPGLWRYHFAAHYGIACCRLSLRQPAAAAEALRSAIETYGPRADAFKPVLYSLLGQVLGELNDPAAAQAFCAGRQLFESYGLPIDAVLVTIDLAEAYFKIGDRPQFKSTVSELLKKLATLNAHPLAKSILDEFVLKALYHEKALTLEFFRATKTKVREAEGESASRELSRLTQ